MAEGGNELTSGSHSNLVVIQIQHECKTDISSFTFKTGYSIRCYCCTGAGAQANGRRNSSVDQISRDWIAAAQLGRHFLLDFKECSSLS